jgi:hypothetical protein
MAYQNTCCSQETLCDVCGPQFDISSDMDTEDVFQKFLDLTYATQCEGTNKYAQHKQLKLMLHLPFAQGLGSAKA